MNDACLGLVVALACASACDVAEPEPTPQVESRGGKTTSGWGCKNCGFTNSPHLGADLMDRFAVDGSAGAGEFELVGIESPHGDRYDVEVDGSRIRGIKSGTYVEDGDLIGSSLVFEINGQEVEVEIAGFERHSDWVDGADIPTYSLVYDELPDGTDVPTANVCPGVSLEETSIIVTAGETYDGDDYLVEPHRPGWVAMGCRGHVVAKIKLMGYDPNDGYGSSVAQRQAALKMLAADYCGDGVSFTTAGTPLAWQDALGNFSSSTVPAGSEVEAAWNEDGATCLGRPRLVQTPKELCGLKPCTSGAADLITKGADIVSLVPP